MTCFIWLKEHSFATLIHNFTHRLLYVKQRSATLPLKEAYTGVAMYSDMCCIKIACAATNSACEKGSE